MRARYPDREGIVTSAGVPVAWEEYGAGEATIQTSLRDIAEGTGLSKRGVQDALTILARRQLVGIARTSITDIPVYTVKRPWRR